MIKDLAKEIFLRGNTKVFTPKIYDKYKKLKNASIFCDAIDSIIINKYSSDDERDFILSSPLRERRLTALTLLDSNIVGNSKSWGDLYEHFIYSDSSKMDNVDESIYKLRDFVKVADVEKKVFGEVMTPLDLVKDMLNILPSTVWNNPYLKWLDPCNGVGPFPIMVMHKLMRTLKDFKDDKLDLTDDKFRYKYILENMIYTCDIQPKNVFLWHIATDSKNEYIPNTFCGSFLDKTFDFHKKEVWKVSKFDIIIGNPPYNLGTKGGNGGRDLWNKFVYKSFDLLEDDGYLNYVHPAKWRSPEHKIFNLFKENNLLYLEIHSKQDGKKLFGATTRYDFYCLQKSEYNGSTLVKDEEGVEKNIDIRDWQWLPNYNFASIESILGKDGDGLLDVMYSRSMYGNDKKWMSKEKSDEYKFPCVYGMYKDRTCSYRYSNIDKGHFGVSKVILGLGEHLYPKVDLNGEFGIMNNAFALQVETPEQAMKIKVAIESNKFKEIVKSTKWGNYQVSSKMFKSFKKDFWKEFI
jgi:hypothetical protein